MAELSVGNITGVTHRAITQSVALNMMSHCLCPTSEQIEVIASKVVAAFPILADTSGTGHGSWVKRITNRLKNLRRNHRSMLLEGLQVTEPTVKKEKDLFSVSSVMLAPLDKFTYDRHTQAIQNEMNPERTRKRNVDRIMAFMKETFPNRRQWIVDDAPPLKAVLEKFPCLHEIFDSILLEFHCILEVPPQSKNLADIFSVNWENWFEKIVSYAKQEGKSSTKDLLKLFTTNTDSVPKDQLDPVVFLLLCKTITTRPKDASDYILTILGAADNIDNVIQSKNVPTPYIIGVGGDILHITQYYIVCEGVTMKYSFTSLRKAILAVVAIYYIMNINYSPQCKVILSVIERIFLNVHISKKKIPQTTIGVLSSIEKMTLVPGNVRI